MLCSVVFERRRYEVIVIMDDDLQHLPEEIPNLLNKLAEGYDVVYATREEGRKWPLARHCGMDHEAGTSERCWVRKQQAK